ncbi:glyoxalase/bleomycin resistance protein/dioxygenase [Nitratireductor aquibiodomus RA22]|uniref:VOC domain-containing protein n=2 Tax=Nitratireductor aquibiodomus TaxID=204799 RepID=A0A1H4MXW7_9HYPH|nr:VOC family protein [Nitratireductor aquibiodomus]EIM78289.1 glyoxalase/bleomycin resistance protein/dioxygenase [Nitratireductor aquibiodomus RA22]SEB87869.1 hypothetical protein SAMN05216452_3524 [Nitratireductor aquibiodomus]
MTQHGQFHWNELKTRDAEKTKAFYGEAVGWTFDGMDMGDGQTYWVAMVGETPVGGIFTMAGPEFEGVPEHWMSYLAVDDVDAALEKAKGKGGEILREPFDVPGVGRIAILREPGGAVIGWMTPALQE